jgi:hypothetical protein
VRREKMGERLGVDDEFLNASAKLPSRMSADLVCEDDLAKIALSGDA